MMQNEIDILKMIEGMDEMGTPKAICSVGIHGDISENDSKILESAFTLDAEVSVYLTQVWAVVDLHFTELLSYDLFHMVQVCKNYTEMMKQDKDDIRKELVLTIAPAGEYDQYIIRRNAFWSLMSENLEDYCDTLRFIFMRDQFGAYEFSTEDVEQMLDEISQELEIE